MEPMLSHGSRVRSRSAVTLQLISTFILAPMIVQGLFFLNLKFQASIFCGCTAWFVSDLVGNPDCWFCHAKAPVLTYIISVKSIIICRAETCSTGPLLEKKMIYKYIIYNLNMSKHVHLINRFSLTCKN